MTNLETKKVTMLWTLVGLLSMMVVLSVFAIGLEEDKINILEEEVQKLERAQIATTDFNEALMVRNDELEGANEQLLEFTKLYECKGL